jgi:hypothetical protein
MFRSNFIFSSFISTVLTLFSLSLSRTLPKDRPFDAVVNHNHKFISYNATGARLWAERLGFDHRQGQGRELFSSPPRLDRLWVPPSLLSNAYQGLFPCG